MTKFAIYITFLLSLTQTSVTAQLTVSGYTNYSLSGFNVLVEDSAFIENNGLTNAAINLLESKLIEIVQFNLSQEKIDSLKAVPIFMDWNTTTGAAQYHPSQAWLIANGYAPEKERCVEISNITNFINWTNQNQPYMVMHELAHAYHHRVLNFNSAVITYAYNNVLFNNLYTNVLYHSGGGNYFNQPTAYALTNDKEYFAEISEAYFGLNDYFPFNYNDLSAYDPIGFAAAVEVWGDIMLSVPGLANPGLQCAVYPNPGMGAFSLHFDDEPLENFSVEIFDLRGKQISSQMYDPELTVAFDISDQPSGVYFVHVIQMSRTTLLKIIKN